MPTTVVPAVVFLEVGFQYAICDEETFAILTAEPPRRPSMLIQSDPLRSLVHTTAESGGAMTQWSSGVIADWLEENRDDVLPRCRLRVPAFSRQFLHMLYGFVPQTEVEAYDRLLTTLRSYFEKGARSG